MGPDNLAMREYIYSLIDPAGVKAVLDIGCGNGHDLIRLGERLIDANNFVGLDVSEEAIAGAGGVATDRRCSFMVYDASQGLPFPDAAFDLVYSLNFLECVRHKQAMIREMHRVLAEGGQVVCGHFDWDMQAFDGVDKALVRKVVHAYSDWQQDWMANADGWMGRRLWREFQAAGGFEGRVETYALANTEFRESLYGHMIARSFAALARQGAITEQEYAAFMGQIERLAANSQYFYSINMYIYTGRKA